MPRRRPALLVRRETVPVVCAAAAVDAADPAAAGGTDAWMEEGGGTKLGRHSAEEHPAWSACVRLLIVRAASPVLLRCALKRLPGEEPLQTDCRAVVERSGNRWGWRRQQPRRQVLGSGLPWLLTLAPFVFTRTFFSVCAAAGGSKREQVGRGTHGGPGKALLLVRPPRAGTDVATCSVEATRALMTRRPSHGGRGGEGEKTATIRPYQHK